MKEIDLEKISFEEILFSNKYNDSKKKELIINKLSLLVDDEELMKFKEIINNDDEIFSNTLFFLITRKLLGPIEDVKKLIDEYDFAKHSDLQSSDLDWKEKIINDIMNVDGSPNISINKTKDEDLKMVGRKAYKRIGNRIKFGSYYINNDKEKEPIEWDILLEIGSRAFIISHYILKFDKFDDEFNNYENSYIRNWLNNDFYNIAFDDNEKSIIDITSVDNSIKSTGDDYNKYTCNDTNDKIFLLSIMEAGYYCIEKNNLQTLCTVYAKKQIVDEYDNGYSGWWLRSPMRDNACQTIEVDSDGYFGFSYSDYDGNGIRPACWIKLV